MSKDLFQRHSFPEIDFYGRIAPIYDPMAGPFLKPLRRAIIRLARDFDCRRILDVGCGTGEQAIMLANNGFTVTGIDLSPAMLDKARQSLEQRDGNPGSKGEVSFIHGDAANMPFAPASFDCALLSLALHEMDYQVAVRAANETLGILAPGGKVFIFDYLRPSDYLSRLSLGMMHVVERMAGRNHFGNFRRFIGRGGLEAFMEQFPARVVLERKFFGGAIGLIAYETER